MEKTNLTDSANTVTDSDRSFSAPAEAVRKPRIGLKVRTRIKAGGGLGGDDPGDGSGSGEISPPGNHGLKVRTAL